MAATTPALWLFAGDGSLVDPVEDNAVVDEIAVPAARKVEVKASAQTAAIGFVAIVVVEAMEAATGFAAIVVVEAMEAFATASSRASLNEIPARSIKRTQ